MPSRSKLEAVARFLLIAGTVGLLVFAALAGMANRYEGEPPGPSALGMAIFTFLLGLPSGFLFLLGVLLALVELVRQRFGSRT